MSKYSTSGYMVNKPSKKFYKKKASKKTQPTIKRLERKINTISKSIEVKRLDGQNVDQSISNVSSFYLLNGIGQGDDSNNRSGNNVMMTSIYLKGTLTVADSSNLIRLTLVMDTQTNGGAPTETLLFSNTSYPYLAFINYDYRKRFKILWDEVFIVDTDDPVVHFKKYLKLKKQVSYLSSGATVAGIGKNSLYLVANSDSTTTTHPLLTFLSRLKFADP